MQLSCDPRANVACISLRERHGDVETIEVTSDFLVDAKPKSPIRIP